MTLRSIIRDSCLQQFKNDSSYKRIIETLPSGVVSVEGNPTQLLTVNAGNPFAFDLLAGRGQILDASVLGEPVLREFSWEAQTGITAGAGTTNRVVMVDKDGVVTLQEQASSKLTSVDYNSFVQLGSVQTNTGFIISIFSVFLPTGASGNMNYSIVRAIDSFSLPSGLGISVRASAGNNLQLSTTAGTAINQLGNVFLGGLSIPNDVAALAADPAPIVVLVDPNSNIATFSPTGETDPSLIALTGDITSIDDSGGFVRITSSSHGMQTGDPITSIQGNNDYVGSGVITSNTANVFVTDIPYTVDSSGGIWTGLTAVSNGRYTAQRLFFFPGSSIVAAFYGIQDYASIEDFDASGGELAENLFIGENSAVRSNLIIVRQDATDLNSSLAAFRNPLSRFKA